MATATKRRYTAAEIAEIDRREYGGSAKRSEINTPGTGGDPIHKRRLTDETNRLTT